MIEDEDFVLMIDTVDRRLTVPQKTNKHLIDKHYESSLVFLQFFIFLQRKSKAMFIFYMRLWL